MLAPAALLQRLIQFDTTNPPGNEAACIGYVRQLLAEAGIESTLLARTADRPNLIARLPGLGSAPPLLLYGHADVVTTEHQRWQHPPFEGRLVDGFVWGRGALDMKGGLAMLLAAFLRAAAEGQPTPGDLVLAVVSDEEAGGDFGARFLVEQHAQHFSGIRHALGEFGGFSVHVGGRRFYPIQVAEKQRCWMKATVRGTGGHGAIPVRGGAMAGLGRMLQRLDRRRLPVHVTPVARMMLEAMAQAIGGAQGLALGQLTRPWLTDAILDRIGPQSRALDPLLHNTVSPTILRGSRSINVIPGEVAVELDGRLLPGYQPEDMIAELRAILGEAVALEVVRFDPGPASTDLSLFDTLAGILREADPDAVPIPFLLSAITDGRFFARLGIQTYGFLPMPLPQGFNFIETIHAADERVPVAALDFGAEMIYRAIGRIGNA